MSTNSCAFYLKQYYSSSYLFYLMKKTKNPGDHTTTLALGIRVEMELMAGRLLLAMQMQCAGVVHTIGRRKNMTGALHLPRLPTRPAVLPLEKLLLQTVRWFVFAFAIYWEPSPFLFFSLSFFF